MQKIRKKLSLVWGVPEAAVMNIPVVTVQGNGTASIENYKSILLYTSEQIRVLSKEMIIGIYGKNLKFDSINEEILIISGNFEKIEYNEVKNV